VPFRILHVAAMPFPSVQGTQVYIGQMCALQARAGHDVHLLTYHHGSSAKEPGGFVIHRLGDFPRLRSLRSGPSWGKVLLDLRMAGAVRRLVGEIGPDIVHAHHYEALAACLLAGFGRFPLLYHAHTLMEPELPWYFNGRALKACTAVAGILMDTYLPAAATACAAISPYLVEVLVARGVPRERVFYVPPSVEAPVSRAGPARDAGCRWDFIYAGNLDGYQGVEAVLSGFALLLRGRGDLSLGIVSDSDPGLLRLLAGRLGIGERIAFEPHGSFESVFDRILGSRIALVPRRIPGGFPMKLLNYLHARRPVIATVQGSWGLRHRREVMVHDGIEGFVHCAREMLGDAALRERIALAGHEAVRKNFRWAASLKILDGIYSRLIGL
jgi:glycosyltransferase involved in cell wall biosynthesis